MYNNIVPRRNAFPFLLLTLAYKAIFTGLNFSSLPIKRKEKAMEKLAGVKCENRLRKQTYYGELHSHAVLKLKEMEQPPNQHEKKICSAPHLFLPNEQLSNVPASIHHHHICIIKWFKHCIMSWALCIVLRQHSYPDIRKRCSSRYIFWLLCFLWIDWLNGTFLFIWKLKGTIFLKEGGWKGPWVNEATLLPPLFPKNQYYRRKTYIYIFRRVKTRRKVVTKRRKLQGKRKERKEGSSPLLVHFF